MATAAARPHVSTGPSSRVLVSPSTSIGANPRSSGADRLHSTSCTPSVPSSSPPLLTRSRRGCDSLVHTHCAPPLTPPFTVTVMVVPTVAQLPKHTLPRSHALAPHGHPHTAPAVLEVAPLLHTDAAWWASVPPTQALGATADDRSTTAHVDVLTFQSLLRRIRSPLFPRSLFVWELFNCHRLWGGHNAVHDGLMGLVNYLDRSRLLVVCVHETQNLLMPIDQPFSHDGPLGTHGCEAGLLFQTGNVSQGLLTTSPFVRVWFVVPFACVPSTPDTQASQSMFVFSSGTPRSLGASCHTPTAPCSWKATPTSASSASNSDGHVRPTHPVCLLLRRCNS